MKWRIALPEPGNSTPIVWGDRVFVTQPVANAETLLRWKLNQGDAFVVECEQQTDSQVEFSGKSAATTSLQPPLPPRPPQRRPK